MTECSKGCATYQQSTTQTSLSMANPDHEKTSRLAPHYVQGK